ncbi:MAG: hypothetical protein KJ067_21945 [Vicinamibacteria bacterium]|nr:hypothetical protein [Vicinamibacteria bacterium]
MHVRPHLVALIAFGLAAPGAAAQAPDFWKHWGDGQAEMNGYRLVQPRYGATRTGQAVLVYVTEDFTESTRVKADPGKHPKSDVFPVLKLNAVRQFRTGVYDYSLMTSVFARVAPGFAPAKVSFSSQEWCGHVYHHVTPRAGRVAGLFHSYFDGEADGRDDLPLPAGGVFEDALPVLLRAWAGELVAKGASREVPLLPSLQRARLEHKPLAWTTATISRAAAPANVTVPAGRFDAWRYTVREAGGRETTYDVEAASPYRLLRWTGPGGEVAELLGSDRMAYWQMNGPGGEAARKRFGLQP